MLRIQIVIATLLLACSANGQVQSEKTTETQAASFGWKGKLGYSPMPWHRMSLSNIPESLRTVQEKNGYVNKPFDNNPLDWNPKLMLSLHVGPVLNFKNRLLISGGGAVSLHDEGNHQFQYGCYCVGSSVTYMHIMPGLVLPGVFGEASVRTKGSFWLAAEATYFPIWRNIDIRHGYSAYNQDETLKRISTGSFRVPFLGLAGVKICAACDDEFHGYITIMGGVSTWKMRMKPEFSGIQYPSKTKVYMIQVGLEGIFFRH